MTGRAGTPTAWPDSGGTASVLAPILAAALVLALGLLLVMLAGGTSSKQDISSTPNPTSTQRASW